MSNHDADIKEHGDRMRAGAMQIPQMLEGDGRPDLGAIFQAILSFAWTGLVLFMGLFSFPLEVFVRWNFGERYLTILRFFLGGAVLFGCYMIAAAWSGVPHLARFGEMPGPPTIEGTYIVLNCLFTILWIAHKAMIGWRNHRRIRWHSRSSGASLLLWLPFRDRIGGQYYIQLFVEPLLALAAGGILWQARSGRPLALFLLLAGLALLLKGIFAHVQFRGKMLDAIDQHLEGRGFDEAFAEWTDQGRVPQSANGFQVTPFFNKMSKEELGYHKTTRKLSNGLQAILSPIPEPPADTTVTVPPAPDGHAAYLPSPPDPLKALFPREETQEEYETNSESRIMIIRGDFGKPNTESRRDSIPPSDTVRPDHA